MSDKWGEVRKVLKALWQFVLGHRWLIFAAVLILGLAGWGLVSCLSDDEAPVIDQAVSSTHDDPTHYQPGDGSSTSHLTSTPTAPADGATWAKRVSRSDSDGPVDCGDGTTPRDVPAADLRGARVEVSSTTPPVITIDLGGVPTGDQDWRLDLLYCAVQQPLCLEAYIELSGGAWSFGADPEAWFHGDDFWAFRSTTVEVEWAGWGDGASAPSADVTAAVRSQGACDEMTVEVRAGSG